MPILVGANPYAKDVINEALVVEQGLTVGRQYAKPFVERVVHCGVHTPHQRTHCSAVCLQPKRVVELEDVLCHDDLKSL